MKDKMREDWLRRFWHVMRPQEKVLVRAILSRGWRLIGTWK